MGYEPATEINWIELNINGEIKIYIYLHLIFSV